MYAGLLHPTVFGDDPLVAWAAVVAFVFVFVAAVIIIGVWITRLLRRRGGKR